MRRSERPGTRARFSSERRRMGRVLAIDQDESALARARRDAGVIWIACGLRRIRISETSHRLRTEHGFLGADGVLADIGISSMMVDDPSRGFSFMREGPLDMRMDQTSGTDGCGCRQHVSVKKKLPTSFITTAKSGARVPIARSIVRSRPLQLTTDLARAVERVMGGPRYGQIHPATRTFQALRIYVNDELGKPGEVSRFIDDRDSIRRPPRRHYFPFAGRPDRETEISRARAFPDGC